MAIFRRSKAAGRKKGMSPFKAGLLAIVLVVVGTYFAYTKANPFADPYEFSASFNTVNNLQADSEVRIAGVEVGTVKTVEPIEGGGDGATVTMEIEDHGLPIHEDAEIKIRPNIFLEGNEFVDLEPGSPTAPVLDAGGTIPVNQTATPVQLGQVLSVLQTDTREDLRTFLEEYAFEALNGGGARAFNDSIEYWEDAYRNTGDRQRGAARHAGGRPVPRPSRAAAHVRRPGLAARRPAGAREQLQHHRGGVRGRGRRAGGHDPGAARRPGGGRAGARVPQQLLPGDPALRGRRAPGRSLLAGHDPRRVPADPPAQPAVPAQPSSAGWPPTCGRPFRRSRG